jgi:PAP_fibrillin
MNPKTNLYQAIAPVQRGLQLDRAQLAAIFSAVAYLEEINPTLEPTAEVDLLSGDWRLLFTTSQGLLGFDRIPGVKLGQIYQSIRAKEAKIYNVAELETWLGLNGLVSVCASFTVESTKRVKVNFERTIAGLKPLLAYQNIEQFIELLASEQKLAGLDLKITNREQRGWLETTYLDRELRIGRGNEGSLFILQRVRSLTF